MPLMGSFEKWIWMELELMTSKSKKKKKAEETEGEKKKPEYPRMWGNYKRCILCMMGIPKR